jgi:hypothetical protein
MVHKTIHRKQKISNMNPLIKLGGDVNQTVTFKTIEDKNINNKGNAKRGVSPRLKIRPCDLDL